VIDLLTLSRTKITQNGHNTKLSLIFFAIYPTSARKEKERGTAKCGEDERDKACKISGCPLLFLSRKSPTRQASSPIERGRRRSSIFLKNLYKYLKILPCFSKKFSLSPKYADYEALL